MRHAHAEPGDRMDRERGLTDKGREQCRRMRSFFDHIGVEFDHVVSSDFARAAETAMLMHTNALIEQLPELEPDGTPEDAWAAVSEGSTFLDEHVLVVTHDPLIQPMLAAVCFGFAAEHNLFDHANVVHLDKGVFKWWMTPKLAHKVVLEESEREAAESAVDLAEHLMHRSVRKGIDPLIEQVRTRVAARFRAQARSLEVVHMTAPRTYTWSNPVLKGFNTTALGAYTFGAQHAGLQLGWLSEARRKNPAWLTLLPGINRTAASVEADLDATSADQLSKLWAQLSLDGASNDSIFLALRKQFKIWANGEPGKTSRAATIATTEIATAYHHGMRDVALLVHRGGNGPVEKSWDIQPDACELCQGNAEQGWIDAEAPFTSGHFEPPGHPSCRCSLAYRTVAG